MEIPVILKLLGLSMGHRPIRTHLAIAIIDAVDRLIGIKDRQGAVPLFGTLRFGILDLLTGLGTDAFVTRIVWVSLDGLNGHYGVLGAFGHWRFTCGRVCNRTCAGIGIPARPTAVFDNGHEGGITTQG